MATFKANYLFDTTQASRLILTYNSQKRTFAAAMSLVGAAEGYAVYSTGQTPQAAIDRAIEACDDPSRWRRMKF